MADTDSPTTTPSSRPAFAYGEGILLMVGFVVVSVVFASFVGLVNAYAVSIALPMLSIAGIVLLLICLAGIAYVFARADLQDKSQALGLPSGSIQAVIALSLIVLFAILSIFLFTSLGSPPRSLTGLNQADRDEQVAKLASNFAGWQQEKDGTFTVFVRDPATDARNDVGKQLIVLIGTLMTSAVGFYFGSRATAAGAASSADAIPVSASANIGRTQPSTHSESEQAISRPAINRIEPSDGIPRGRRTRVEITGIGLSQANGATFVQGEHSLEVSSITLTSTGLVCEVNVAADAPIGAYDVAIKVSGQTISKAGGLKVV